MPQATAVIKASVPAARLKRAGAVLEKLGLSPAEAFNLMLAQVEIQKGLPFVVSLQPQPALQSGWNDLLPSREVEQEVLDILDAP